MKNRFVRIPSRNIRSLTDRLHDSVQELILRTARTGVGGAFEHRVQDALKRYSTIQSASKVNRRFESSDFLRELKWLTTQHERSPTPSATKSRPPCTGQRLDGNRYEPRGPDRATEFRTMSSVLHLPHISTFG